MVFSSLRITISPGMSRERVPLGPFTDTLRPEIVTSTPDGTVMGAFPIRDISFPTFVSGLPDEAQNFAADFALARFAVGEKPLASGQNCNTKATQYAWDFL